MSDYAFIAEQARKAFSSVASLERRHEENPNDVATQVNLAAMRKVANRAREELERLAQINDVEICQYRLVPAFNQYQLGHVAQSLLEYQNLFSQIYDALKGGKKQKAVLTKDILDASALEFGYTYAGSLGVALLVKSTRDLASGTLDPSIDALLKIIDIDRKEAVKEVAARFGRAVVKRVHDWSKANAEAGFSADVRWKRSDGRLLGKMIDRSRMQSIVEFIEAASDESRQTVTVIGMLVALSLPRRSFQLVVPDGPSYSGHFESEAILPSEPTIGRIFRAEIEISEVSFYALDQEKRTNKLTKLDGPLIVDLLNPSEQGET